MAAHQRGPFRGDIFRTLVLHIEPVGSRHRGVSCPVAVGSLGTELLMLNDIIVQNPARINRTKNQMWLASKGILSKFGRFLAYIRVALTADKARFTPHQGT